MFFLKAATEWVRRKVRHAVRGVVNCGRAVWVIGRAVVRVAYKRFMDIPTVRVHKVYAFADYDGCTDDNDFGCKRFGRVRTFEDLPEVPWPRYRLEVRYVDNGRKYRAIYHVSPKEPRPASGPLIPPRTMGTAFAPKVTYAYLRDGWHFRDVTSRVAKYMGPNGDFFAGSGLRVYAHEIDPFEDFDTFNDGLELCIGGRMARYRKYERLVV